MRSRATPSSRQSTQGLVTVLLMRASLIAGSPAVSSFISDQ